MWSNLERNWNRRCVGDMFHDVPQGTAAVHLRGRTGAGVRGRVEVQAVKVLGFVKYRSDVLVPLFVECVRYSSYAKW